MPYISAEPLGNKEYIIDNIEPRFNDGVITYDVSYRLYEYKVSDACFAQLNKFKLHDNVYKLTKKKYHRILKKHNAERTTQKAVMKNGGIELYNRGTKYVSIYPPKKVNILKYNDYYHYGSDPIMKHVRDMLIKAEEYPAGTLNEMMSPKLKRFANICETLKNTDDNIIYVMKKVYRTIEDNAHNSDDIFYTLSAERRYHRFKDDVSVGNYNSSSDISDTSDKCDMSDFDTGSSNDTSSSGVSPASPIYRL